MIALLVWVRTEDLVHARQVLHPKLLEHFLKDGTNFWVSVQIYLKIGKWEN